MAKNFMKKLLNTIDKTFETSLYKGAKILRSAWLNSKLLNIIRRCIDFTRVKQKYKIGLKDKEPLRLHLGCGGQHLKGYLNIDWRKTDATDLVCNIAKLPYPGNSVCLIETYHAIEHLPRHDFPKALKEWRRVLCAGGRLIIECPDFDEIVKRYLEGCEEQLDGIFGLQRFEGDYHLFGYNFQRLKSLLKGCGFINVERKAALDYHSKEWPCIRVESVKDKRTFLPDSPPEHKSNLSFTGERAIEGKTPTRIWLDHVERYKFASRYVKGKNVLDIACGTGYGSKILCEAGAAKVIAIDISSEVIDFASLQYSMSGLEFKVGNILNIDSPENSFDVITCFETIEHIQRQEKVLAELQRVLQAAGLLIISSPNRILTSSGRSIHDHPINPFHTIEYTTKEFISSLENYFEILEVYGQRSINKLFLLPILHGIMRKTLPMIYSPKKGQPKLEKVSYKKEYRYITAVCKNSMSKI